MTPPKSINLLRILTCESHGDRRWQGHVVCDGCGRVYQTKSETAPRFAPKRCSCGAALMPPESEQIGDALGLTIGGRAAVIDGATGTVGETFATKDSEDWMARPICYLCYRLITKRYNGAIPHYADHRARRDGN